MTIEGCSQRRNLAPGIRASLNAKLERLLARPLIARVIGTSADDVVGTLASRSARVDPWRQDAEDGTCTVRVSIDYGNKWRGREKEVLETVSNTVESHVAFLTDDQKLLLERSPREFLALSPPPETTELISFEVDDVPGSVRVVRLKLALAPESPAHVRHVAVVPNLVQIERQLDALHRVETATDDGPLGPLRALVGICDASRLEVETGRGQMMRHQMSSSMSISANASGRRWRHRTSP